MCNTRIHNDFVQDLYNLVGDEYSVVGIYRGSNYKVEIRHTICGYSWQIYKSNFFSKGSRCPKCSGKLKYTTDTFKERIFELVGNEYSVLSEYKNANTKIKMKHNTCGYEWNVTPSNFTNSNSRCPKCSGLLPYNDITIREKVYELTCGEYEVLGKYKNVETPILIRHNSCNHEWSPRMHDFISGSRCPMCYGNIKKDTNVFKDEVYNLVKEDYTVIGDYINATTKIKIRHNNESCNNHEFEMQPYCFLSGQRCPKCNGTFKKSTEQFKQEVYDLVGNEYVVIGEYEGAMVKTEIYHSKCNNTYNVRPSDFLTGNRCPHCSSSKGEVKISEFLNKNLIINSIQYTFDDCFYENKLKFDFAIFNNKNDLILLIEYDGRQHFEPVDFGGKGELWALEEFKKTQIRDEIKNQYCSTNNIPLLRIPYWEFNNIEQILHNELSN